MSELRFRHAREGFTGTLQAQVSADGPHGAVGPGGVSPSVGFPKAIIDAEGWLRQEDGTPYLLNPAEVDGTLRYRITVISGQTVISVVAFPPVDVNGVIDVNGLLTREMAQVSTPEQIAHLNSAVAAIADYALTGDLQRAIELMPDMAMRLDQAEATVGTLQAANDLLAQVQSGADSASDSKTQALTAAAQALQAAVDSGTARNLAQSKASEAALSAQNALQYQDVARASSESAQGSADAAYQRAQSAEVMSGQATQSAQLATAERIKAESANTEAQTAATAAQSSASTASTHADEAAQSASATHTDMLTAKTSADTAAQQATAATQAQQQAATSATEAGNSAAAAQTSVTAAQSARDAAAGSADTARQQATAAAESATQANSDATDAGNSAAAASNARVAAESARDTATGAADIATQKATAAAGSASQASTSATNAGNSASAAQNSATLAQSSYNSAVMLTGNPDFEQGFGNWMASGGLQQGRDEALPDLVPSERAYTLPNYPNTRGSKVAAFIGPWWIQQRHAIPVDTTRRYRLTLRVLAESISADGHFFAGIACLDGNYTLIDGPAGPGHYVLAMSERLLPVGQWKTYTVELTGESGNGAGNTFMTGTKMIRPLLVAGYGGDANDVLIVDYFTVEDVTESARAAGSASAAATSASQASTSATNAGQSATAAQNSATSASTSAGNAQTYANQASTSAGNAANSATQAGSSATQAGNSATAAQGSATTASNHAASAQSWVQAASKIAGGFVAKVAARPANSAYLIVGGLRTSGPTDGDLYTVTGDGTSPGDGASLFTDVGVNNPDWAGITAIAVRCYLPANAEIQNAPLVIATYSGGQYGAAQIYPVIPLTSYPRDTWVTVLYDFKTGSGDARALSGQDPIYLVRWYFGNAGLAGSYSVRVDSISAGTLNADPVTTAAEFRAYTDQMGAEAAIKVQAGNVIAGIGARAAAGVGSEVGVVANRFFVTDANFAGGKYPFVVENGEVKVNGNLIATGSISASMLKIGATSLVNDPNVTGTLEGWNTSGSNVVLQGWSPPVRGILQSTGDTANASSRAFPVSASRGYQFGVTLAMDVATTPGWRLFGLAVTDYNGAGLKLDQYNATTRALVGTTDDPWFWIEKGDLHTFRQMVGLLLPYGTDPRTVPLPKNVQYFYVMPPNAAYAYVRLTNYGNGGAQTNAWWISPSVTEIGGNTAITGDNIRTGTIQSNALDSASQPVSKLNLDTGAFRVGPSNGNRIEYDTANGLRLVGAVVGGDNITNIDGSKITTGQITATNGTSFVNLNDGSMRMGAAAGNRLEYTPSGGLKVVGQVVIDENLTASSRASISQYHNGSALLSLSLAANASQYIEVQGTGELGLVMFHFTSSASGSIKVGGADSPGGVNNNMGLNPVYGPAQSAVAGRNMFVTPIYTRRLGLTRITFLSTIAGTVENISVLCLPFGRIDSPLGVGYASGVSAK